MDPATGGIVALAAHPTFDPNGFILGFDEAEIARLSDPDLSQEDVGDLVTRGEEAYAEAAEAAAAQEALAAAEAAQAEAEGDEAGADAEPASDEPAAAVTDDVEAGAGAEEQPA